MVISRIAMERGAPLGNVFGRKTVSIGRRQRDRSAAFPVGKIAVVVVFVCALGLVWEFRRPWFQGNLGVVDPGKVIRSAQPTSQLSRWVREFQSQVDPQPAGRKLRRIGGTRPRCGRPTRTAWRTTICR